MSDLNHWQVLSTGQVSDAMDDLGVPRGSLLGMHVLHQGAGSVAGRAFTLRQVPARNGALPRHGEVAAQLALPGDFIVIDVEGRLDVCSWGLAHSLRAMARGVVGLVVNGAVRDASSIRDAGFPVFCKGTSPVRSLGALQTESLREPLVIDAVRIEQGDLILADTDGVIRVPAVSEAAVLAAALAIRGKEELRDVELRRSLAASPYRREGR